MSERDELLALARVLLEPVPTPAALVDDSGALLLDNPAFREACGYLATTFQLDPGLTRNSWTRMLLQLEDGELRVPRQLNLRAGSRPARVTLRRIDWGEERLIHLQVETERRPAEGSRLTGLGQLATKLAHELKNPLTWVAGNLTVVSLELAELLQRYPEDEARLSELREAVREAQTGASRLTNIIKDLESVDAIDRESMSAVDPRAVLESAARSVEVRLPEGQRIERDLWPLPQVLGNEARLSQVFVNLLVNAAQAAEATGGAVRLEARATRSVVTVDVIDGGPGIPDEVRPHVFREFFTTKPQGTGTGLGLAICRSIVTGLSGQLDIAETGPEGTRMRVTLPVLEGEDDHASDTTISLPPVEALAQVHLLIVDDEPLVCKSLRRSLSSLGPVTTATSVQEALSVIAGQERIDVLLCDLMMPGLGGIDLYEQLAERRPDLVPRMVFMTGGAFSPRVQRFVQKGQHDVLHKPPDLVRLKRLLLTRAGAPRATR